jgi:superfamily II DNA helicase RecQ
MAIAFFWIPASSPHAAQEDLNRFLASRRVLAVDRQFIADGLNSAWSVAVDHDDGVAGGAGASTEKARVDYREILDPATFAVFATLRARRKELAELEGVPAHVIATNEQMAQIARMRAASLDDLKQVDGLGESRLRRYGRALLDVVAAASKPGVPVGSLSEERSKAPGEPLWREAGR